MKRHGPGFTLIELIVTSGLAFLVVGLFYTFLARTRDAAELTTTRVGIQQAGIIALERLLDSLASTDRDGVFTLEDGVPSSAVAVVPVSQVDSTGRRLWAERIQVFYWDEAAEELRLAEWRRDEAAAYGISLHAEAPPAVDRSALEGMIQASKGTLLASNVTAFSFTRASLAQIVLTLEAKHANIGERARAELKRTVYFREVP